MEEQRKIAPQVNFSGAVIIFFILLFVFAKWGPSIPFSVLSQNKGEPMIVSDTGKATIVPDIAKITVGIESQGPTLKQVQDEVNKKSKNLIDSLKKLGIDEKDIKTINYSVNPEYDYQSTPYRINGYRVSTSYEVKITDFEVVNEVLTIATQSGANVIGNISFEVNEKTKEEYTQKAREEAVKLAKAKAEGLAKASGITLGKIINVTESQGINFERPIAMLEKADTQAVIQPGQTEIAVMVTLSYEIR